MSRLSAGADGLTTIAAASTSSTARSPSDGQRPAAPGARERVAAQYRSGAEADDPAALAVLFRPDVLVDTHVPNWRFQLEGAEAAARRACVLPRPGRFTVFDAEPTEQGLLVQFEWRTHGSQAVVRQLHRWRLDDGRIAEQLVYCAGVWDRALQARIADAASRSLHAGARTRLLATVGRRTT